MSRSGETKVPCRPHSRGTGVVNRKSIDRVEGRREMGLFAQWIWKLGEAIEWAQK